MRPPAPVRAAVVVAVILAVVIALAPSLQWSGTPLSLNDARIAGRALLRGGALAVAVAAISSLLAWPVARAMPPLLLLAWAMVGPLPRALGVLALGLPPGSLAIVLAGVAGGVPWIALLLQLRLRSIDGGLLDAARNLGAGPWQRWWRIEWPQARGTLGFGALWIALQSSGDTATAEIAGGGKVYSAALLLRDAALVDDAPALMAVLLLALVATAAPVTYWVARRLPDLVLAADTSPRAVEPSAFARVAVVAIVVVVAALPLLAVLPQAASPWSPSDASIASRIDRSLGVAAAVLAIALPVGAAAAIGAPRAGRAAGWIAGAILLPLVIPPVVYGLAALDLARWSGVAPGPVFTVLGTVPVGIALVFVATMIARPRVPPALIEAAANLGAGPWMRARRVWLPRMGAAWAAAALLVVAWCWSDAMIAPFTSGPGDSTVAVAMTLAARGADAHAAARWAWVQIGFTAAAVVGATRLWGRR